MSVKGGSIIIYYGIARILFSYLKNTGVALIKWIRLRFKEIWSKDFIGEFKEKLKTCTNSWQLITAQRLTMSSAFSRAVLGGSSWCKYFTVRGLSVKFVDNLDKNRQPWIKCIKLVFSLNPCFIYLIWVYFITKSSNAKRYWIAPGSSNRKFLTLPNIIHRIKSIFLDVVTV